VEERDVVKSEGKREEEKRRRGEEEKESTTRFPTLTYFHPGETREQ
jgi:hypothetical protein